MRRQERSEAIADVIAPSLTILQNCRSPSRILVQ